MPPNGQTSPILDKAAIREPPLPERVQSIGTSFFEELDAFVQGVRSGDFHDVILLAEGAHKMKGAAALLGQYQLEEPLGELEKVARARAVTDLHKHIDKLVNVSAVVQKNFYAAFPKTNP